MKLQEMIAGHRAVVDYLEHTLSEPLLYAAEKIIVALTNGGKVLTCGNGGSAADAQHFAAELVCRFLLERRPLPAIALTTDSSILSAIGNDYGFESVFKKQVEALGQSGDILLVFSTSGNSANVVRAVEAARAKGLFVIGLLGGTGGALESMVDLSLRVGCTSHTPRIQEGHLIMLHAICEHVEAVMAARTEKQE